MFILAGDLNSMPDGNEIKTLHQEFTFPCVHGCPLTFPSDKPAITIDYIIMNPSAAKLLKVADYDAIRDITASDHLPLMGHYMKQ